MSGSTLARGVLRFDIGLLASRLVAASRWVAGDRVVGGKGRTRARPQPKAFERLRSEKALEIVPGATHLFEEPGALESVTALARD